MTTPGATRFYRSAGARAVQAIHARVAAGGRLEWLPLETLVHSGAHADNRMRFELAPGAEMFGWDCVALGLPAADAPFVAGDYRHDIAVGPRWLERGRTAATDTALLDGPCGWAGQRALGTLWFAAGSAIDDARREQLLEVARGLCGRTRWRRPPAPPRRSPTSSPCACSRRAWSRCTSCSRACGARGARSHGGARRARRGCGGPEPEHTHVPSTHRRGGDT